MVVLSCDRETLKTIHRRALEREVKASLYVEEMFSTGNYSKVMPILRFEERMFEPGPVYRLARRLYWDFAHA